MSPDDTTLPPTPEGATLAGRPSARARQQSSQPPPEPASSTPRSADDAASSSVSSAQSEAALAAVLLRDEVTRAHGFAGLIGGLSAGVLLVLPVLEGDQRAKLVCAAAIALIAASSLWMWLQTRGDPEFAARAHRIYGWTMAISGLGVEYYLGFFSPVGVVITLGLYYYGQSNDRQLAKALPAFVSGSFVLFATLTTFGVVEDHGLFNATQLSLGSHIFATVAIAAVLILTGRMAAVARRSMRASIERSNEALLVAHKRGALLVEAQQHLERALGIAIGKPGRHTGRMAGPYLLDVVVGLGAMGEIYAAEHTDSHEKVAIKLLQPNALGRPELVERFLREGTISQSLQNPHVVQVFAVGTLDDGAPYMAMELLRGADLAARLRKDGSLPIAEVVALATALADGLEHAHAAGIVHRDLKPVNVFQAELESPGEHRWKILDFGISKLRHGSGTLTDLAIVGTPGYMSPEQARGHVVDHRSDIFSMAVVLYRALTGRPAFSGTDTPQIMFDIVYRSPERPGAIVKKLPTDVDLVLAIALAKDPADRFQSAGELATALQAASEQLLDSVLRARAYAVIKAYPWGQPALWSPSSSGSSGSSS